MFRRFMIVSWILFSIFVFLGLIGLLGQQMIGEPEFTIETPSGSIVVTEGKTIDELRQDTELKGLDDVINGIASAKRAHRNKALSFRITAWSGALLATAMLIWNIIWYTAHWIWMGRYVARD